MILFIFLLYQHSSLTLLIALNVNPIIVELYKYAVCEKKLWAVFHSDFRTKNGAHTTLTMIPNSRKQVPCVFLLVLEIIWDWDQKCWPIPLTWVKFQCAPFLATLEKAVSAVVEPLRSRFCGYRLQKRFNYSQSLNWLATFGFCKYLN